MIVNSFKQRNIYLFSLGFNTMLLNTKGSINKYVNKWNEKYKSYLSGCTANGFLVIDQNQASHIFKKLDLYINFFFKACVSFLFVSIDKDYNFSLEVYSFLQDKIYSYFIYDWIFGVLANFRRIWFVYDLRDNLSCLERPEVALLLRTSLWTKEIINELKSKFVFCFGVVDPEYLIAIDFPIPMENYFESCFVFLQYILKRFRKILFYLGYLYVLVMLKEGYGPNKRKVLD